MTEHEIFVAAIQLTGATRMAFLDAVCGRNGGLRNQVDALLKAHDASGGLLPRQTDRDLDVTQVQATQNKPGTTIAGRYKLIEAIGEGGMGTVWLAEQKEPVKRKVAVKLVKAGMDTRQVLARFEAERQALALMDHPNIAKVFDGGMTDQGRPYFVMEFVKGVPLTEYCDQARLSLKQRLELFVPICQAVQHAHQKGIIHRDLKPSNLLICLYDGKPVPKVIDFGLAKAMHQSLTEQTLHTAFGVMIGTPLYMSPEQAEHNNLDVDTRTDIYSLGVILYELLTGTTPLERQQLKEAVYNEILRLIKDVEPPKPSTRLSASANLPNIASQRSIDPNQLRKSLTGDLDWIVMKALDKDRGRRYETANGLARDVERFLNDEAVEASPPSSSYRLRKLMRKHHTALKTGVAIVLLFLIGFGSSVWLAVRARIAETSTNTALKGEAQQRERAELNLKRAIAQEAIAQHAEQTALAERDAAMSARQRTREALDEISSQVITDWLAVQPELTQTQIGFLRRIASIYEGLAEDVRSGEVEQHVLAHGYYKIGKIYDLLGNHQAASAVLNKSSAVYRALLKENSTSRELRIEFVSTLSLRARSFNDCAEEAWQESERLVKDFPDDQECFIAYVESASVVAQILGYTGRSERSIEIIERALPYADRLLEDRPNDPEYRHRKAMLLRNQYNALGRLNRFSEMNKLQLRTIELVDRLAEEYPDVNAYQLSAAYNHLNRGMHLRSILNLESASKELEHAAAIQSKLTNRFPSVANFAMSLGQTQLNLTRVKLDMGKTSDAFLLAVLTLETWSQLCQRNPDTMGFLGGLASARINLANATLQGGDPERALTIFSEALRENQIVLKGNPRNTYALADRYSALQLRANAQRQLGRFQEAAADLREAVATWQEENPGKVAIDWLAQISCDLASAEAYDELLKEIQAIVAAKNSHGNHIPHLLVAALIAARASAIVENKALRDELFLNAFRLIADWRELTKSHQLGAAQSYDLACFYSIASRRFTEMSPVYSDQAMEFLQQAVKAGWKDATYMQKDVDLVPLRDREDFKKLLEVLQPPSAPDTPQNPAAE